MSDTPFVMLPIPVEAARDIAETYGYDQVIILARREAQAPASFYFEHLTTYGGSDAHSNSAAANGYHLREAVLNWHNPGDKSRAVIDVLDECRRQVEEEGFTAERDDAHVPGHLALAGAAYAIHSTLSDGARERRKDPPSPWPWADSWWKPKDRYRDLVRAAALLVKELERMNRAAKKGGA